MAGIGVSGAGGRSLLGVVNGEGWAFIGLELQCDKENFIYGGGEKD